MSDQFQREAIDRLARIETKMEHLSPLAAAIARNDERISKLEGAGARYTALVSAIATVFGGLAAAAVSLIPPLFRHG